MKGPLEYGLCDMVQLGMSLQQMLWLKESHKMTDLGQQGPQTGGHCGKLSRNLNQDTHTYIDGAPMFHSGQRNKSISILVRDTAVS